MALAALARGSKARAQSPPIVSATIIDSARPNDTNAGPRGPLRAGEFNMVGQYDIDWLLEPPLQRLLDHMAASPTAFGSVRFFHALDSGGRANTIDDDPLHGGIVWPDLGAPMNFSRTFDALATLTARGLAPFIVLNFFPKAVSAHAATPPQSLASWKELVRRFLDELAADARFAPAMRDWKFEVWNEPNGAPFWRGRYNPQYFDLYRATSEAVVGAGHAIRLGGPAIVYRSGTAGSRRDVDDFLKFVSAEPNVKCDFISLHAKGSWSSRAEPEFRTVIAAVTETAELALAIDRARFRGMEIINDEADMRVGFNVPYQSRMDERFAAWMCALMIAYDGLSSRFRTDGLRFLAASDNANQQLVRTAFDGRRSLCTRASGSARDLLKLPIFNFYEILRLLGDRHGTILAGRESLFPNSDLFHAISVADTHVCSVFSIYPQASTEAPRTFSLTHAITDIPWSRVNIARFRIDAAHSNAYSAASEATRNGQFPDAGETASIRRAQELAVSAPIESGISLADGKFEEAVTISPYAIVTYWITPYIADRPADPAWIEASVEDDNVILRWRPNSEPHFYTYEVYLVAAGELEGVLSPVPLRSAMWVDTAPPPGMRSYAVRAVSASGVGSNVVRSDPVMVGGR